VRFTLGDSERLRVRLRVAGPGRRIRGLATVLAEQLEVEAAEAEPAGPSAAGGWIELALASGAAAWRPEAPGEVAGGGRDVREAALWSGVAAAGIGIGAVGLIATQSAERSRVDAARALQVVERLESERVEPSERELRERAADLRRLVSSEAGTGAAFGAALRLASRAAGDGVMLESLTGRRDQDGSWLELRARAMGETAEAARARFGALVSALDDSALSTETTAGSMRLREGRGAFEASGPATVRLLERESAWMPGEAGR
jgi:hypothetical protein